MFQSELKIVYDISITYEVLLSHLAEETTLIIAAFYA